MMYVAKIELVAAIVVAATAVPAPGRPPLQPAKAKKTIRVEGCVVKRVADVQIASREKGQIAAVLVREGDDVIQGQLLARIDNADAKPKLARRTYHSPIDGVLVEVSRKSGEEIDAGQPLCRIVNLNRLAAEGFVKAEVAKKLVGREVRVEVLPHRRGNPVVAKGEITFVSPAVNPVDGRVLIRAEFATPVRGGVFLIRPGLIATLVIPAAN